MALKWMDSIQDFTSFSIETEILIDGQTIVAWDEDKPYIKGLNMLLVYLNGIEQQYEAFEEYSEFSIQFHQDDYLKAGDIISIHYKLGKLSLGDIKVCGNLQELYAISRPVYNEVALVVTTKKLYIYKTNGWQEFVIPFSTQNLAMVFQSEKQIITDVTQRTYTLSTLSYSPDTGSILVFVDGRKFDTSEYVEVDGTTITFNQDFPIYTMELEVVVANTDMWDELRSHIINYEYYPNGSIKKEVIKVGLITIRETEFQYDLDENIIKEIIAKGTKFIVKSYSYDTDGNILAINVEIT